MAKLYIDTSNSDKISITIDGQQYDSDSKRERAQALLPLVVSSLESLGLGLKDVSEIEVNCGPGSFTGLRVGVAVANALGWSLGVPVNGKLASKGEFVKIKYS